MSFPLNKIVPVEKRINDNYVDYQINDIPKIFYTYLRRGNIVVPQDCTMDEALIRHAIVRGDIIYIDLDYWKVILTEIGKTINVELQGDGDKAIVTKAELIIGEYAPVETVLTIKEIEPEEQIPKQRKKRVSTKGIIRTDDWYERAALYKSERVKVVELRKKLQALRGKISNAEYELEKVEYEEFNLKVREIGLSLWNIS